MGRKSNVKDQNSSSPEINLPTNNDTNDLYRKRLRSWKQTTTQFKSNHSRSVIDDEVIPFPKSTIYTYPINLNNNHQTNVSNTILSESLTTESAFYGPSISCASIQTNSNLNNNHVTTLHTEDKKRRNSTLSCESLSSQFSQSKTLELLPNPNNDKQSSTNNLQLAYQQNITKRSRLSTNDSIITNHRFLNSPLLVDDDTIDINQLDQQEPLSSSINNSNPMEAAVKMVQPIVDIIFNAFEDQLKTLSNPPLTENPSHQLYPPTKIPYLPLTSPIHPLVLHAVNFNIQLTTKNPHEKQTSTEQYMTNATLNENGYLQSISLTELKQKLISYVLSNNLITNDEQMNDGNPRKRRKLKRFVQLAVLGVSVLCGYLLL